MKFISRRQTRCFCAFCKAKRKVYPKKHVDLTNVAAGSLLSVVGAQALYGRPDPRFLMIFAVFMMASEIFIYLRWRAGVVCKLCGFDPVVYKRSPDEAARLVREFFTRKSEDASFQLSRSPLLEVQRQRKQRERRDAELKLIEAKMLAKRPKVPVKPQSQLTPIKSP